MRLSEHGKHLDDIFMFLPSKMAFYCVTKSREPTTNESDMLSAFVCTLFVSVDDSCCEYFLINVKSKLYALFFSPFSNSAQFPALLSAHIKF